MKLPLFSKKNKEENLEDATLLALDIGTEFVKAVIFSVDPQDKQIHVLGFSRVRQHSNAMQGAMIINLENVINSCDIAIGEALVHADKVAAQKSGKKKAVAKDAVEAEKTEAVADVPFQTPIPTKAIFGIAGELVQGVTIVADYEREEPEEKIEKEETEEVIKHIKKEAFNDAVLDISDEIGIPAKKLEEINSRINATYIDGLKVDSPIGFTGKDVSYKIFSTFAPSIHVNSLREIADQLQLEIISIEVEPYAITRAVKGARSKDYNAVYIDIGGGTTDVAMVENGSIIGTKMFAYGGKVFTKRIAEDLKLELHEAEEVKIKYTNGQLDKAQETQVKKALAKDIKIWVEGVELSLAEMEDVETYPLEIYLCGGGSALPEIKQGLMQHPWLQVLPFVKYPKIEFLFPKQLIDIVDETDSLINPEEVAPLALARMVLEHSSIN